MLEDNTQVNGNLIAAHYFGLSVFFRFWNMWAGTNSWLLANRVAIAKGNRRALKVHWHNWKFVLVFEKCKQYAHSLCIGTYKRYLFGLQTKKQLMVHKPSVPVN